MRSTLMKLRRSLLGVIWVLAEGDSVAEGEADVPCIVAPATFGQRNWRWDTANTLVRRWSIPDGVAPAAADLAFDGLISAHESLRTKLIGAESQTMQVICRHENLQTTCVESVKQLLQTFNGKPDIVQRGIVTGGDNVQLLVWLPHFAADAASARLLHRDWLRRLDPSNVVRPSRMTWQPRDLARYESGLEQARADDARRHWLSVLNRVRTTDASAGVVVPATLRSVKLAAMVAGLAASVRLRARDLIEPLLLLTLGRAQVMSGEVLVSGPVSNRFRPELRRYVGPAAQDAVYSAPIRRTFDPDTCRAIVYRRLRAIQLAHFPPECLSEIFRSYSPPRVLDINDMSYDRSSAPVPRSTEIVLGSPMQTSALVQVKVNSVESCLDLKVACNAGVGTDSTGFLRIFERVIIDAAASM